MANGLDFQYVARCTLAVKVLRIRYKSRAPTTTSFLVFL
jgi:hypothetical protein